MIVTLTQRVFVCTTDTITDCTAKITVRLTYTERTIS